MNRLRILWLGIAFASLACRLPTRESRPDPEAALLGCWQLSDAVFRGLPARSPAEGTYWSLVEIARFPLGRYGAIRVLGAPTRIARGGEGPYRLHGWRPVDPDSVEITWTAGPNAMEVRLHVRGDSAIGEFFYHGDIWVPGQTEEDLRKPAIPISAVRVSCPDTTAG